MLEMFLEFILGIIKIAFKITGGVFKFIITLPFSGGTVEQPTPTPEPKKNKITVKVNDEVTLDITIDKDNNAEILNQNKLQ